MREEEKAEQRECQQPICEGDTGEPGHSVPEEKVPERSRERLSWAEEDMGAFLAWKEELGTLIPGSG